jgi:hypothetical protein
MNATAPVKSSAVGLPWLVVKSAAAMEPARRERPEVGGGARPDPRKMPNGDPPPATLWGTDQGG